MKTVFHYRIVGFEQVNVNGLEPHAAALARPIDPADAQRIGESVRGCGAILVPLLVSAGTHQNGRGEKRWIYEGVHRWRAGQTTGCSRAPCFLVETNDPQRLVYEIATARRQLTAGARVLMFLEQNADKLDQPSTRSRDRLGKFEENHGFLTIRDIAEELRCSEKDVATAIALRRAIAAAADPKAKAKLQQVYVNVMIGRAPIRRLRAAMASLDNPQPNSPPQNRAYGVFRRRLAQLEETFSKDWQTFDRQQKRESLARLNALLHLIIRQGLEEVGQS